METNYILLILLMGLATYLTRALPALFVSKWEFSPRMKRFLNLIPYTVLGALIFPSILYINPNRMEMGIVGGIVAGILAWFKKPVIVCVLGAIGSNLALYYFF